MPEPVGELVADAILNNRFFVPTHREVVADLRRRVEDWDGYLDAMLLELATARRPGGENGSSRAEYVGAIAAPIFNPTGHVTHNVRLHPFTRVSPKAVDRMGRRLTDLTSAINQRA
jgi:DNA-binding IclR family transcriptional regulator